MAVQRLTIPILPPSLNRLMRGKLRTRMRLGGAWAWMVRLFARDAATAPATGKRRVSLVLVYPRGRKLHDPDSFFKAVGDGLVRAGLLVDDGPGWVEWGTVRYARGTNESTEIILEDL
jgi:hypothetical protein